MCGFIWIASIQIHLNNKNVCIISGRTLYNAQSMCMSTEFVHSVFYSKAPSTVIILMHLADFAHRSSLPFSQMHTIVWNSSVVENGFQFENSLPNFNLMARPSLMSERYFFSISLHSARASDDEQTQTELGKHSCMYQWNRLEWKLNK